MASKKVTRELADFINSEYRILGNRGISGREATGIINSFLHDISLSRKTIDRYGNESFDDVRKKFRDYSQKPEVKARQRDYFRDFQRKMTKPLSGEFKAAIDMFTGFDVKLTTRQVWEKYGGQYGEIIKVLNSYHRIGLLNKETKNGKACYSLNPESSFKYAVGGFFKDKEKEL